MPVNGQPRRVMVRPERDGYIYILDRTTGEVLSADPFVDVTSSKGVDLKTGLPILVDEKTPVMGKTVRDICPAAPGSKDWQPSAYSPQDRPRLHPAPEPVHGLGGHRGRLHPGPALRRRQRAHVRRPRRLPRRDAGLGPGHPEGGLERQGAVPGLERGRRHRGRRRVLRNDGGLVQGAQGRHGRVAVAVQDRLRDHRPADRLPRTRRPAVRGRPLGRGRLGRCRRGRRPRRARRDGGARVRRRQRRPAERHHQGGMLYVFALPQH